VTWQLDKQYFVDWSDQGKVLLVTGNHHTDDQVVVVERDCAAASFSTKATAANLVPVGYLLLEIWTNLRRASEIHNPLFSLNTGLRSFRLGPLMCQIWTFR
jgi:hypothetical protein